MNNWQKQVKFSRRIAPMQALQRQPQNFQNMTLASRRREHFCVFSEIFLVAELPPKEVF